MPTIATPPHARLHELRDENRRGSDTRGNAPSIVLRMQVAARRAALTQALAEGADPASSALLALRARQLTSSQERAALSGTLQRTIEEARRPSRGRFGAVPIRRRAVIEADEPLRVMIARLRDSRPVAAEGMALINRIITDGTWSPLYNATAPGALRRLTVLATAALEPGWPGETSIA
jgi:hypothetical protein